jgi:hypothetical protein
MTNESAGVREPFQYRRLLKRIFIAAGAFLLVWGAIALNNKILSAKRFDQLTAWYKADQAEREFNASFPNDREIEKYLTNATILVSDGSFVQAVYYFDEPHHFLQWRNEGLQKTDLIAGEWFTEWYFLPMELKGRWRIAFVHAFCHWFPAMYAEMPQDSCSIVGNLNFLFGVAGAVREYRVGNIFKLSVGGHAPFPLPNQTQLSIEGLLALQKAQRQQ